MKSDLSVLSKLPTSCEIGELGVLLANNLELINTFVGVDVRKIADNYLFDSLHPSSAPGDQEEVLIFFREGVVIEGEVVNPQEVIKMLALAIEEIQAGFGLFDSWLPWKKQLRKLTAQEYMTLVVYESSIYPGFDWRGVFKLNPKHVGEVVEVIHTGRDIVADLPRRSKTPPDNRKSRPTYLP